MGDFAGLDQQDDLARRIFVDTAGHDRLFRLGHDRDAVLLVGFTGLALRLLGGDAVALCLCFGFGLFGAFAFSGQCGFVLAAFFVALALGGFRGFSARASLCLLGGFLDSTSLCGFGVCARFFRTALSLGALALDTFRLCLFALGLFACLILSS